MHTEGDEQTYLALAIAEYHQLRGRHPELGALRPAHFAVGDQLSRTLGLWDLRTRTISLARKLLQGRRWPALVHVLTHEAAHQLADEAYGAHGRRETAHGPSFRRACAALGIDHAATLDEEALLSSESPESDVARKIRKLLALTASPNRHEAEAALAKAQYLALKYNVELAATGAAPGAGAATLRPDYAFRLFGQPKKRFPAYTWAAASLVCDHYFVQYICRGWDDRAELLGGGRFQIIELYGRPDNLDLAEYVLDFLLAQGEREWTAFRKARKAAGERLPRGARNAFVQGMVEGFRGRLTAERARLAQTHALVWQGDPALDAYYRERNPHVRTFRRGFVDHTGARAAGEAVGRELSINPAVKGAGGTRGLLGG